MNPVVLNVHPVTAGHLALAIFDYRERMKVSGRYVPDDSLARLQEFFTSAANDREEPQPMDRLVELRDANPVAKVLTYEQVAGVLSVSKRKVEQLVHGGGLTAVHIGGCARIRCCGLNVFIESLPTKAGAK